MHPTALPSRGHNSNTAKICQVPRYLGLTGPQDLDEIANTNFLVGDQVKQAEAGTISQGPKKHIDGERFFLFGHAPILYMA